MLFHGALTALVTPFRNGQIDEEAFRNFIEWQIQEGIDGLVPCGTTGEAATMSLEEQGRVIRICVEQANKRVPVLAGAGSNNTSEAIELAKLAKKAQADGILLITPYYNKPTHNGLIAHFSAVANAVDIPIVLYNVPGRTSLNMRVKTIKAIVDTIPNVVGIKEATGDVVQASEVTEFCMKKDFSLLSGDDFTVLPLLSVGGCGAISVVSNIMPAKMAALCAAFKEKDLATALKIHIELQAVIRGMFIETNPIPVKTALALMGKIPTAEFRLPLVPLEEQSLVALTSLLKTQGLI